jgi:hypothetical protein
MVSEAFPDFPVFRALSVDDKPVIDSFLKVAQPRVSELTFTNLFVWDESEPVRLSRLDDVLLVQRKRLRDGKTFLLPPLGSLPFSDVLAKLKETVVDVGQLFAFYGIRSEQLEGVNPESVRVEADRDDWDYVYLAHDLAELAGDKYHPKRNFIRRCLSQHSCKYVPIGKQEVEDCLALQAEWCNLRKCDAVPGLEAENTAIKRVFEHYEYLGVLGGAVYVNDKLEAFTLAEALNDDTAVIHFEKANPEVEGLYQVINQWFCQKALTTFKYVNREQYLGVPGLRKSKLSYYPHHMIEKNLLYLI